MRDEEQAACGATGIYSPAIAKQPASTIPTLTVYVILYILILDIQAIAPY
jgi:hypothetical protein